MKRRDLIKGLTLLPLAGGAISSLASGTATAKEVLPLDDLFKELGVVPVINAGGTMTYLSGSLMMPEVLAAINATSHDFANMHELEDRVGEKIATMLHCESAMVTSGAACALTIGTAACITGSDPKMIAILPNLPGPQREVVIQKSHRYIFDHAVRMNGVKMVEVEGAAEMEKAINENTVMALFFNAARDWTGVPDTISHEDFVAVAKRHKIPTFIDAAADVPPVENLFKYQKIGFDLVTFSGGKMLRGPQSAGILLGRKDLIDAAKLNFSPHECPIGRPMKVNKEEIFGMYVALKSYLARDHKKDWQDWLDQTKRIASFAERVNSVKGETHINPGPSNAFPGLILRWDMNKVKITPREVMKKLHDGNPRIQVSASAETLNVSVVTLRPDQIDIVGRRIKEVLESAV